MNRQWQLLQIVRSPAKASAENYAKNDERAIAPDLHQIPQLKTMLKIMNRQLLQISSKARSRKLC